MTRQTAKVKSVSSGDTLILTSLNNASQERTLSLAFVTAPRLRKDGDEAFAFESRDFLRSKTVGKVIQFQVLYTIQSASSKPIELGRIWLQTGESFPELAVAEGWLKLRDNAGRNEDSEEAGAVLEQLRTAEAKAKAESKGLWSTSAKPVQTTNELSDADTFLERWKGKSIDAIIERILSGDRLLVRLLLDSTRHQQAMLMIAGVRAPMTKRVNPSDGKEQPGEEGGDAARIFVEERLLQRNVKVTPLGLTPQKQLIGTVRHPNGSIAEFIIKAGLGWCQDMHSTLLGSDMATLREGQKAAKQNRLGVFKGHIAPQGANNSLVEAHVTKIQSADTLFIRSKAGGEKRVNLSSIRQPKPSDAKQAPFGAEAKEFLRKRLIGKNVRVTIDAKRPAQDGFQEREMATITHNNQNVALVLVENGWASVIRHRKTDEDRSPIYDELLAAEEAAQQQQKGMWSPKPPTAKTYVDASENVQKAKIQLSVLQRQKKVPAVVDYVKSGSRFTVLVPKENAKLTLVLSGIRAPRTARNASEKDEPYGAEALEFANRRVNQRDVEVDVENIDKTGGFIGTLYINRESFAKILVEEGLATVHAYSAEQSGTANELFAAESRAKEARKNLWHDWDPSKEAEEDEPQQQDAGQPNGTNGEASPAPRNKDYRDVVVTNVDETCRLKLQQVGSGTASLTELMSAFRSFHMNPSNNTKLPGPPKAGDLVAAQFSEDGEWYRAKVRHNDRTNQQADVLYIDYGNGEKLSWSKLRALSQPQFSTQKLRPQASDAVLSFLQFPTQSDYLADAVSFVQRETLDKQLVANVDRVGPEGTLYVTLLDPQHSGSLQESFNADVVGEGFAMVPRKLTGWEKAATEVIKALQSREEEAKKERKGMWEYGDLTED
ncbi:MAG: hypothetical protein M1817_000794 [Caeruleum heppii]|nr:MAG: hypothetical protein M1817_000794 [Caeruleum heppii]